MTIRRGREADVAPLFNLGTALLAGDRLSRRSLRALIKSPTAVLLLAEAPDKYQRRAEEQLDFGFDGSARPAPGEPLGYALVLFHRGAKVARLHSMALAPKAQRRGVAQDLLDAAEAAASERHERALRLEAKAGDETALKLFDRRGYRRIVRSVEGETAVRLEKSLVPPPASARRSIPFYAQSTDFTCGPAALMMAFAALGSAAPLTRERELALWRQATSIYLISAPGGCEPVGMGVTAARHGFKASVHVSEPPPYFIEARKGEQRREVMLEAQRVFRKEAEMLGVPVRIAPLPTGDLRAAIDRGAVAVVLVSSLRLHGDKVPHWIVVFDHDVHHVYACDPWVPPEKRKRSEPEVLAIPLPEFERLAAWGRSRLRATVLLESRSPGEAPA